MTLFFETDPDVDNIRSDFCRRILEHCSDRLTSVRVLRTARFTKRGNEK